ncbi:MAG: hypothetical protein ACMXYL_02090 [Candidatus Woesearchaeota archaeon]
MIGQKHYLILTCILLLLVLSPAVYSQPYTDYKISNAYYLVQYNEERTATVYALFDINNRGFGNVSLNNVVFNAPDNIEIVEIVQADRTNLQCRTVCARSISVCADTEIVCIDFDSARNECLDWQERCNRYRSECQEYREECTEIRSWYFDNRRNYRYLSTENMIVSGLSHTIPIEPVKPGSSTSIMVKYTVRDAATPIIQNYFSFKTLSFPVESERVRAGVSVDEGLFLAGTASAPRLMRFGAIYSYSTAAVMDTAPIDINDPTTYDRLFNSIMRSGQYVRERTNVGADTSINVRGRYSSNWFMLYLYEILLFFGLTIGSLLFWNKWLIRYDSRRKTTLKPALYKNSKDFHVWRAVGLGFTGLFFFVVFILLAGFIPGSLITTILLSLAFITGIGTLLYTNIIHSGKEMLASIGFSFLGIILLPMLLFFVYFMLMILSVGFYF